MAAFHGTHQTTFARWQCCLKLLRELTSPNGGVNPPLRQTVTRPPSNLAFHGKRDFLLNSLELRELYIPRTTRTFSQPVFIVRKSRFTFLIARYLPTEAVWGRANGAKAPINTLGPYRQCSDQLLSPTRVSALGALPVRP
jgi:hypothetical protein